jgi:aspartate kinase
MKVFKFGGASVSTPERLQKVASIINQYNSQPLTIIVSAIGKTTNALEKVAEAFYSSNNEEALKLFTTIKEQHTHYAKEVLTNPDSCISDLHNFFTEIEWQLHDKPVRSYDNYYDQIVCIGELLSTTIVAHYLQEQQVLAQWIDIRDVFITDDNFREANIQWELTETKVQQVLAPLLNQGKTLVVQGFIGCTANNESTTLGREGSDYTAAVLANMLNAESQTIWKDVPGVMNADPKQYNEAVLMPDLSFYEVIEMAYYGAQVIHPKTIKPLQNKNIPLYVKCFLDSSLPGTVIHNSKEVKLPPVIIVKQDQVLITLSSKDFSFIGEEITGKIYELLAEQKLKPNLTQNGAISMDLVMDNRSEKLEKFALAAGAHTHVRMQKDLTMLTVRHYNTALVDKLAAGKTAVLKQQSPHTVQILMANN